MPIQVVSAYAFKCTSQVAGDGASKDGVTTDRSLVLLEKMLEEARINPVAAWLGGRNAAAVATATQPQKDARALLRGPFSDPLSNDFGASLLASGLLCAALLPPRGERSIAWQEQDETFLSMLLALRRQTDTPLDRRWLEQVLKLHCSVREITSTSVNTSKLFLSQDAPGAWLPSTGAVVDRLLFFGSAIAAAAAYSRNEMPLRESSAAAARRACEEVASSLAGALKVSLCACLLRTHRSAGPWQLLLNFVACGNRLTGRRFSCRCLTS